MKKRIIFATLLLLFSSNLYAHQDPNKCPSVSAIVATPLDAKPYFGEENVWMIEQISHYDTNTEWSFTFGPVSETSKELALVKGKNELATLHYDLGPDDLGEGYFACTYSNANGVVGMATTPPQWPDVTG